MRRHGWQLPLHPLQIVGMAVFSLLVVSFYLFLGPFLGNRIVENTVLTLFSVTVFSAAVLFIRCTAVDPSDRTSVKKKKGTKSRGQSKLNYKFILYHITVRLFRRMENTILKRCIRRRYLDPWSPAIHMEPLLPFPLVVTNDADAVPPHLKHDDITFCSLCDFEVKKHSKHCRSCDRCVDGFDHHCRWLNNCVGRKNYTTFILLMVFILLMLVTEGVTAIAIFVRCFADSKGIEKELQKTFHTEFPRGVLVAIAVILALLTVYSCAALGQLFFFHVVLIRKGMRTYDYILAMREESQFDPFDELDLSSDDSDLDSPEKKPTFLSRFLYRKDRSDEDAQRLSIRIDKESNPNTTDKKSGYKIDPWKLIKMSKEKAAITAERARGRIMKQKQTFTAVTGPSQLQLKPLQSDMKRGPSVNLERKEVMALSEIITPVVTRGWFPGSPSGGRFSSPRRRFSSGFPSPRPQKYRSNFDLKLTEVPRDLICSVLKKEEGDEASPRSL